jgi:hypothetical protein
MYLICSHLSSGTRAAARLRIVAAVEQLVAMPGLAGAFPAVILIGVEMLKQGPRACAAGVHR